MHSVSVRQEILDRVLQRRGRVDFYDGIDAKKAALVVIDMQNTFCAAGAPAEVPTSRGIVPAINALTPALREIGVTPTLALGALLRLGIVAGLTFLALWATRPFVRVAAALVLGSVALWWAAVVFANAVVLGRHSG